MESKIVGLVGLMLVGLNVLTLIPIAQANVLVENKSASNISVFDRDSNLVLDPLQPGALTSFQLSNATKGADFFEFKVSGSSSDFANAIINDNSDVAVVMDGSGTLGIKISAAPPVQKVSEILQLLAMVAVGGFLVILHN